MAYPLGTSQAGYADFRNLAVYGMRATHAGYTKKPKFASSNSADQPDAPVRGLIPTNIVRVVAEGPALARFLLSPGSASELEYQLLLASDLGHLQTTPARSLMDQVQTIKKMASSLIRKTSTKPHKPKSNNGPLTADS
jgi:hypothetical protein